MRRMFDSAVRTILPFGLVASAWGGALASEMDDAPPPFGYRDNTVVPIDMETVHIDYVFDAEAEEARATARVQFHTVEPGYPMFDLVPSADAVRLNGEALETSQIAEVETPHNSTTVRAVQQRVEPGPTHILEIDYELDRDDVSFYYGRVRAGFFMGDLSVGGRNFFEQYGPANLEYDHVKYTFDVRLEGVDREHTVFTNGRLTETGENSWAVEFPEFFTTSSIYFHLTEADRFAVERFTFEGIQNDVPVTVYSSSSSRTRSVAANTREIMSELEADYGPFLHERLVIYATSGGGGMEYCGATMTSQWALGHELTHSWFARGVMPADGNAGWVDEAIASWRDDGYPRASGRPNRSPVRMAGFADYRRHTSRAAYTKGAELISEFDYMFADDGGMKPVLRELFAEKKRKTITTPTFQAFLERVSGIDLEEIFRRYVYGESRKNGFPVVAPEVFAPVEASGHPRPFTEEELRQLR